MAEVLRRFQAEAAKSPVLTPLFSTYQNNFPQINVDIDRNRAKQLGVNISDITETLQTYLGSYYVNDFNIIGRVYQVRMQADAEFRATPEDILKLQTRNADGNMVPLSAIARIEPTHGPELVTRYNGFYSGRS